MRTFRTLLVAIPALAILALPVLIIAAPTPTLSHTISAGTLAVDIVTDGTVSASSVASPSVTFSGANYSYASYTTTGTLGVASSQEVRAIVPNSTTTWTVAMAATGGPTAVWTSGGDTFDFNDPTSSGTADGADTDSVAGQLTFTGGTETIAGVPNNTACPITNISEGSSTAYSEGVTNSATIFSAAGATTGFCRWNYTSSTANLSQVVPGGQPVGTYTLPMTLTIT